MSTCIVDDTRLVEAAAAVTVAHYADDGALLSDAVQDLGVALSEHQTSRDDATGIYTLLGTLDRRIAKGVIVDDELEEDRLRMPIPDQYT